VEIQRPVNKLPLETADVQAHKGRKNNNNPPFLWYQMYCQFQTFRLLILSAPE